MSLRTKPDLEGGIQVKALAAFQTAERSQTHQPGKKIKETAASGKANFARMASRTL
jgi:hypothetical protein